MAASPSSPSPNQPQPASQTHKDQQNTIPPPPPPLFSNISNKKPSYAEALTGKLSFETDVAKENRDRNHSQVGDKNQISTLFLSRLSQTTTPFIISNAFKRFGQILGIAWRRSRSFAFVKFAKYSQASEAIYGMNGRRLQGRILGVNIARAEMRVNNEQKMRHTTNQMQFGHTGAKIVSLVPNVEIETTLSVSALLIDKEPVTPEKAGSWLNTQGVEIVKVTQWGPFGVIVQCKDKANYNRLFNGPSINIEGFLKIQPMDQRKGKYSRIAWLEVKGIPFEGSSLDNITAVAKNWGEVLYVAKDSYEMARADSLLCLVQIQEPKPIEQEGWAKLGNGNPFPIWVSEVQVAIGKPMFRFSLPFEECVPMIVDPAAEAGNSQSTDFRPVLVHRPLEFRPVDCGAATMKETNVSPIQISNSNLHQIEGEEQDNLYAEGPDQVETFSQGVVGEGRQSFSPIFNDQSVVYTQVFERVKAALSHNGQNTNGQEVPAKEKTATPSDLPTHQQPPLHGQTSLHPLSQEGPGDKIPGANTTSFTFLPPPPSFSFAAALPTQATPSKGSSITLVKENNSIPPATHDDSCQDKDCRLSCAFFRKNVQKNKDGNLTGGGKSVSKGQSSLKSQKVRKLKHRMSEVSQSLDDACPVPKASKQGEEEGGRCVP